MRLLLDTHTFFWFINGSSKLTQEARKLIENPNNEPFFSVASLWETAIKISIGKLSLDEPFEALIPRHMEINGIGLLSIDFQHAVIVAKLPFFHRDPFDRLLVAQAIVEEMPVVSADSAFDNYNITRLW